MEPQLHITTAGDHDISLRISFVPVLINQLIVREIRSLEHTEGFIAVVASERGSRSAGTSHKHSDYDVVFLFTYPRERYHSVLGHKETIRASRIQQGSLGMHDIELQGIELVTFARKVLRCDLSAIEVALATQEYLGHRDSIMLGIRRLIEACCHPVHVAQNYLSWAEAHHRILLGREGEHARATRGCCIISALRRCHWMCASSVAF